MVGGVSGRIDAFDRPAIAFDNLAVTDFDIWPEIHVAAFLDLDIRGALLARTMRPISIGRRAGQRLQRFCRR